MKVRAKKHLGQHFLRDLGVSQRIANLLTGHGGYQTVLEIGPGMGVLTQYLLQNEAFVTSVVEIDQESVAYLRHHFPTLRDRIYAEDFLRMDLSKMEGLQFPVSSVEVAADAPNDKLSNFQTQNSLALVGNFPYNISSQILFKALDHRNKVTEIVGMFQKEVAQRVASPPGNKDYGIVSVLLQAFYDIEYAFTVPPEAFDPPPKVQSGVIRLRRNQVQHLDCDEKKFTQVVKAGFNQRRKTLRNALKPLGIKYEHPLLDKRAEQLGVAEFVLLTQLWEKQHLSNGSDISA
ncbi:MAG: 16S rRNA (adenine(1518)-N(6)/adenine(1519)-N(6))-dimethyltransferase RsmA [Spirosomaceae bacterium]|jgi:16S rRNA (adenine1518-N6/adenine1519-N6)-dimethyltransferase|nr:16S rRNA (adenine(1518)-N(6)/adenine(1519)-N(6))-dimethyltransferase RsmA [Spirosomataceae bacterium]